MKRTIYNRRQSLRWIYRSICPWKTFYEFVMQGNIAEKYIQDTLHKIDFERRDL